MASTLASGATVHTPYALLDERMEIFTHPAEFERRLTLALGAEPIRDWTYDASQWRQLGFTGADAEQDPGP